jgi:hypothetical protein
VTPVKAIKLGPNLVFRARPNGVAGQAFEKGALAFLNVLRCGFLQHREVSGRGDKCGRRKKGACHSVFPLFASCPAG